MNTEDSELVHRRIARQAVARPDAVAVIHGDDRISYRDLDRRATSLAEELAGAGVADNDAVVVHLERSIDLIVGFLAVLKAGGSYLPLDPTTPTQRVASIVTETASSVAITCAQDAGVLEPHVATIVVEGADRHRRSTPRRSASGNDSAYIVYTSGSTGRPKGVRVRHDALAGLCDEVTARYDVTARDRVLQFAATSFDTSIEQFAVALVNGATLVLPEYAWAPSELVANLRRYDVTVMDLSPPYWRSVLSRIEHPVTDLPLRLTIVGGSAVYVDDCRNALRKLPTSKLINAYGLTETTITNCLAELTPDNLPDDGPAPVGHPLSGSAVVVVDDHLRPVPRGLSGEVCISGPSVADGYVSATADGATRFARTPDGQQVYRTGDSGHLDADGRLVITGRVDRQVKIRGFRVEPSEIEAAIGDHPHVTDCAVVPVPRDGETGLAAYVTVRPDSRGVDVTELRSHLRYRLPAFMAPDYVIPLPEMPTTAHGKVDVAALPPPPAPGARSSDLPDASVATPAEQIVAKLWTQVLDVETVDPDDDFFALGGDSTRAAELMAKLRTSLGIDITQVRPLIKLLLTEASLRGFAAAVERARSGALADPADAHVDFSRECRLDVPVVSDPIDTPHWEAPRDVLLTGATGFLGIYLLRELLRSTDATVHCLVRAHDDRTALTRVRDTALHYFSDDLADEIAAERVVAHSGELAQPLLGLGDGRFDHLARTIDVIHHPGGMVNFIYPYSHMRAANVDGTREIIRLAGRYRNIPVHYTSTMAVISGFGTAGVHHVTESTPLEHADHLAVGYVESKWVAEELLRNASRAGLPVAIYRAADISGDQQRGAWNTATEMCAMKRFVVDTGTAPLAELPLDYTPVDVFAAAVTHIATSRPADGTAYHLTNPGKVNIHELVLRMRARGYEIEEVSWQQWLDRLIETAIEEPDHPMTPFAPLFIDRETTGRMSVAEMYLEDTFPAFTRDNVEAALAGTAITIPPVDAAMLDRYLDYLISIKFLGEPA